MDQHTNDASQPQEALSGPWRGYYLYGYTPSRHWMDLNLTFHEGTLRGDGIDDIGRFVIRGRYTDTGECHWNKQYIGMHSVYYKGFMDGKRIWGQWFIRSWDTGGFVIWPKGLGEASAEEKTESVEEPVPVGRSAAHLRHARAGPGTVRCSGLLAVVLREKVQRIRPSVRGTATLNFNPPSDGYIRSSASRESAGHSTVA